MTTEQFIEAARSMLGTPFKHQGRHAQYGLDCAGLAVCSARQCGMQIEDFTAYDRTPSVSVFLEMIGKNCDRVSFGEEKPGDIWIFQFAGNPQHLAIQTSASPLRMIHALITVRKVVEHDIDSAWLERRRAVFRIKEQ